MNGNCGSQNNVYIGARYVPRILGEWSADMTYEPLDVVLYQGTSYTSRTYVPKGIIPSESTQQYWALTGNYNAQVEMYRQEVERYKQDVEALKPYITKTYNTTTDMIKDETIKINSYVQSLGYNNIDDGGGSVFYIVSNIDENYFQIQLTNNLYANLITNGEVFTNQLGMMNNGVVDCREILQKAVNIFKKITFNQGTYLLTLNTTDATILNFNYGIKINSSVQIDLNNSTIKLDTINSAVSSRYTIFYLYECSNVEITNGTIIGDKETHIGELSEYGHAISMFRCNNSLLSNLNISQCIGDGITIQAELTSSSDYICSSSNNTLRQCTIYSCRRNGISVIGGDYTNIDNCYIYDIYGTSPQACIDVEGNTNDRNEYPKGTKITNCRLINGAYRGLLIYDRSYDNFVSANTFTSGAFYGSAKMIGCYLGLLQNFGENELSVYGCEIDTVISTGLELTLKNCLVNTEIRIVQTSSRENATINCHNCEINNINNSAISPMYTLSLENSIINCTTFLELQNITAITLKNCVLNTNQRLISFTKNTKFKMIGCTCNIVNATNGAIIYGLEMKNITVINCTINDDNVQSNRFLFGPTDVAYDTLTVIGNTFLNRNVFTQGTATTLISVNNYPLNFNQS